MRNLAATLGRHCYLFRRCLNKCTPTHPYIFEPASFSTDYTLLKLLTFPSSPLPAPRFASSHSVFNCAHLLFLPFGFNRSFNIVSVSFLSGVTHQVVTSLCARHANHQRRTTTTSANSHACVPPSLNAPYPTYLPCYSSSLPLPPCLSLIRLCGLVCARSETSSPCVPLCVLAYLPPRLSHWP